MKLGDGIVVGGAMKHGETFEEAVRREVKEEYCCDVLELKFVTANNVIRKHNGKKTHWIALLFTVKVDPQQVELGEPEKMEAIGWFPFDSLPSPLHSMFLEHFEIVKKSGFI